MKRLPGNDPRVWWPVDALSQALATRKSQRGRKRRSKPPVFPTTIVCAICQKETADKAADHCHVTGVVRDWLCRKCNAGLGFFDDDPERMRAAAAYIERHRANPKARAFKQRERLTLTQRAHQRRAAAMLATA